MSTTVDVVCRRASPLDYTALLAVNEALGVWGDWDYLESEFYSLIEDSRNIAGVAEINGEVVAFSVVLWIDKDHVNTVAMRIHPEHQKKKVSFALYGFLKEETVKKYGSHLQHIAIMDVSEQSKRFMERMQHVYIQNQWNYLLYDTNTLTATCPVSADMAEIISHSSPVKLLELLNPERLDHVKEFMASVCGQFFYGGPCCRAFLVSTECLEEAGQKHDIIITKNSNGNITAISFTYIFACKGGVKINLYYYSLAQNPSTINAHIHMLKLMLKPTVLNRKIHFEVNVPKNIDVFNLDKELNGACGHWINQPGKDGKSETICILLPGSETKK